VSVGLGQIVPISVELGVTGVGSDVKEGGRWMRRKGMVDRYACRRVDCEKLLSEMSSATVGYTAVVTDSECNEDGGEEDLEW